MDVFEKHHRHEPQEPQLAAMIDVFSILIIFLIAGTVMGTSSITLPSGAILPLSRSKEALDTAPQMTVSADQVTFSFDPQPYAQAGLASGGPEAARLRSAIAKQFANAEAKGLKGLRSVHVLADRSVPYSTIFRAVKAGREAGIESFNFVSTAKGKGP